MSEGLEAFLVPAVEGALEFSSVIEGIPIGKARQDFVDAILKDIGELLARWEKGQFSGKPYAEEVDIIKALDEKRQAKLDALNITESAAMACRVLIHLLTLKHQSPEKEGLFRQEIAVHLIDEQIINGLKQAIDFLVKSFQKGQTGQTEDEKIASATYDGDPGSGWSWTDWQGLPPMLFFTAAAVDAFAELDLYLIRAAEQGDMESILKDFYKYNKRSIMSFQLCVDMARRWVVSAVLPNLSLGEGQYEEPEIDYKADEKRFALYELPLARSPIIALKKTKRKYPPIIYNNLYGLQILLWSWGDWSDWRPDKQAIDIDARTKGWINQAITQLVYIYDSVPEMKEILRKVDHEFLLPGEGFFKPDAGKNCSYIDAGFLPTLMRLLVLFLVYGVGDRNLLEPVIRNLYVELLQNRNRSSKDYATLWSAEGVEIFSTQRATQALTFYSAYAAGRESRPASASGWEDVIAVRNRTDQKLILEIRDQSSKPADSSPNATSPSVRKRSRPKWTAAENFASYKQINFPELKAEHPFETNEVEFQLKVNDLGQKIIDEVRNNTFTEFEAERIILNALVGLYEKPTQAGSLRNFELKMLKEQFKDLVENQQSEATG